MKNITAILLLLTTTFLYSQNDNVIGNVKSIREKTILFKLKKEERKEKAEAKRLGMPKPLKFSSYGADPIDNPRKTEYIANLGWYSSIGCNFLNYDKKFDSKSRLIEETWYKDDNKLFKKFNYKYNDFDSIIEIKANERIEGYDEIEIITYNVDKTKKSLLTYSIDSPNDFRVYYLEYNENKKLKEISTFDENGLNEITSYDYFDNNNSFKRFTTNLKKDAQSEKEKILQEVKEFDSNGNLSRKTKYINPFVKNKTIENITEYIYDDNNNIIRALSKRKDSISSYVLNKYDYKNRIIKKETIFRQNDEMNTEANFIYDENKLTRFTIKKNNQLQEIELKYKFDKHNNWIEQTKFVNGEKTIIRKRKIEYYD